ncbi:hypothetical protein [Salinarchaeum chitinilyticum]
MRVRDWDDLVADVVESDVDPQGWRAVGGDRSSGVGEDLYLGHPSAGVYQLKTFAKNPFEVRGVGAHVARRIDEDLDPLFPGKGGDQSGLFAVNDGPEDEDEAETMASRVEEVVRTHADAPTTPDALFEDVMDAMESPAYGPMEYDQYGRPEALDDLSATFEEAEDVLEAEFEDVVDTSDVGRGFE